MFAHWTPPAKGTRYRNIKSGLSDTDLEFVTRYALFIEGRLRLNRQDEIIARNERWETDQQTRLDDGQVPGMLSKYRDPVMDFLQAQLHPLMEETTGLSLLPTYSYFRVYRDGAMLAHHHDRPACEVSASLLVGANYSPTWPVWFAGDEVTQEIGDLVVYRGCDVDHWRMPLSAPREVFQVQTFLHYVDANGPYVMCAGDEVRL